MEIVKLATILLCINGFIIEQRNYDLEELKSNLRIYYEKMETIRLRRTDWRIVIYIEIQDHLQKHATIETYEEVYHKCTMLIEETQCKLILDTDLIAIKQDSLQHTHKEINELLEELATMEIVTDNNLKCIRTKRMAPLGIVWSMSKNLFGLLTRDDAILINKNIDQLFKDQVELVELTNQRTHIISAGMEELYNVTKAYGKLLQELETVFRQQMKSLKDDRERTQQLQAFSAYAHRVNVKKDHQLQCSKQLLAIMNTLFERKVHPYLLKKDILRRILNDVKHLSTEFDFPIPIDYLTLRPPTLRHMARSPDSHISTLGWVLSSRSKGSEQKR